MKILNEFVPTRKFLKLADELKDLVDGWNVTDGAAGFPAPSGVVVSCLLKYKYPEKYVCPIFILKYKGPVEVGGLALASDIIGLDGLAVTMGDNPKFGQPITMLPSSEKARDFIRTDVKTKNLKLGCLLTARRSIEETLERVREPWDFVYFMRLTDDSFRRTQSSIRRMQETKQAAVRILPGWNRQKRSNRQDDWLANCRNYGNC